MKFNDYFEFPRQIDMEPFTEEGLARRESKLCHWSSGGYKVALMNERSAEIEPFHDTKQASMGYFILYFIFESLIPHNV